MMSNKLEQMMMAMVGATNTTGEPSGFMAQGLCIPLAATPKLLEIVEALGEDAVADWLNDNEVPAPKSGGLWVIECVLENEEADAYDIDIPSWKWRQPSSWEIESLKMRTKERSEGIELNPERVDEFSRWVYIGALV
jgi:hypothetical protein